ncbi:MAG: SDR family oxidoreductase [Nevskia sp.]|nr:SDR family oxidoreductase [Nevskia sp.]
MSGKSNYDLSGKVAVITGGASGMGYATARLFMDCGARVVVGDLNAEVAGRAFADLAGAGNYRFAQVDVAEEADVERLVDTAVREFGRIDIMFNNAGLGGAIGPITDIDYGAWRKTFDILVGGVFLGTKYAARRMIAQGEGGAIVNTSSIASLSAGAGPPCYSAAKAAVNNFTQHSAVELAPHRIRVNAICPGIIFTPLMHGGDIEEAEKSIVGVQPWPGRGEPEHIAEVALFLASPASEFVTGQMLPVDGGLTAAGTRFLSRNAHLRATSTRVGFTYGTTGRPSVVRKLEPGKK